MSSSSLAMDVPKFLQDFPVVVKLLEVDDGKTSTPRTAAADDRTTADFPQNLETLLPKFVHRTADGLNVVHFAVKVIGGAEEFRTFLQERHRLCSAFQQEALVPQLLEEKDLKCGNTPLLLAAYLGKFEFVDVLVEHGARKDATNKYNESLTDLFAIFLPGRKGWRFWIQKCGFCPPNSVACTVLSS
jgi:hypothetical protein